MSETIIRGPAIQLGPLLNYAPGSSTSSEAYDGPGSNYQGETIPDTRYQFNKDGLQTGRFPTFMSNAYVVMTDQIPSTYGGARIAALQHVTSGTAMALSTTCAGGGVVSTYFSTQCTAIVPLIPMTLGGGFPNSGTPVSVLAIDFGFTVGTTTASNGTVASLPDATLFTPGQWIVIGGAGNSTNTTSLVTQVQSVGSSSIVVYPVPLGSLSNAPIGSANAYSSTAGSFPASLSANAVNPYLGAGVSACFNPTESLARGVSITCSSASATGGTFTVKGYDVYGMAMSEAISIASATGPVYGKKAFKYIASVTPGFTDATYNYSVGLSDVFGFHVRTDKWEFTNIFWAAGFNTASTGWLQGVRTSPATTTTGDVRGTIQVSAIGGGSGYGSTASNGSNRLALMMSVPLWNLISATPANNVPMFGVTQT